MPDLVYTRAMKTIIRQLLWFNPNYRRDSFAFPFSLDSFTTGPSDYDTPSDEIYCPCDEIIRWNGNVGEAVRLCRDHARTHGFEI